VNPYYVIRNLLFQTKHIYAGPTRIVSAVVTLNDYKKLTTNQTPILFYYHSDQLGSTGYITDRTGQILEHEEYLPSGESWFEELKNSSANNRLPWQFNGKELDETGLYYYGARYYNPRAGVWMSPDPILAGHFSSSTSPADSQAAEPRISPAGLEVFTYVNNNPINAVDPDGRYARINRSGNSVRITIPILFRNAGNMSDAQFHESVARFEAGIEKSWTGKFGKFEVHTSVQVLTEAEAKEVEAAVDAVIEQGTLTRDLGGSANTSEVGAAVLAQLGVQRKEAA